MAKPALNHEIIRRWIEDGTADRLIESLRREIAARQEVARETLGEFVVGSLWGIYGAINSIPVYHFWG